MTTTNDTITVITASCIHCGKRSRLTVDAERYGRWHDRELTLSEAFPDLSLGEKELLMTGIHDECWDIMFKEEKE